MNFKAILTALTLVPSLLTLVDETVKSVETSLEGFSGADKLKAALAKLDVYLAAFEADAAVLGNLKTILTPLVNAAVAAFNVAGLFKKADKTIAG